PLSLPEATASRTAFSISRCEVMPTFLRKPRRLPLKLSSFMTISVELRPHRIVEHVFAEIALRAIGARLGPGARGVALLAADDVGGRAGLGVVGAADGVVIRRRRLRGVDRHRLAALEATGEQGHDDKQSKERSHSGAVRWIGDRRIEPTIDRNKGNPGAIAPY